jgi:hypothetical protein
MLKRSIPYGKLPRILFCATAGVLLVGMLMLSVWLRSQNDLLLHYYFQYVGALFLVGVGAVDAALCWAAFRRFSVGEPLRVAWLVIALASAHRLAGLIFSEILSARSLLNPGLLFASSWDPNLAVTFRQFGLFVSGPVHLALLAIGLFVVVNQYRRLGLLARLRITDYLLLACVLIFTGIEFYRIAAMLMKSGAPDDIFMVLNWASDPLLCILLLEAVLLRRAVTDMGWGLIAKCWGSLVTAVFVTALGDMGLWVTGYGYLHWPLNSLTWFIWYPASAAFALAPAYQLIAMDLARSPSRTS